MNSVTVATRALCVMMLVLIPTFMFRQRDLRNAPAAGH
jgi:hypothetical protein